MTTHYSPVFCSCIVCKKEITTSSLENHAHFNHGNLYPKKPYYKVCKGCDKDFATYSVETKFCSQTCAGTFNNKTRSASGWKPSKEQREKTSKSLTGRSYIKDLDREKGECFHPVSRAPFTPITQCHICHKWFIVRNGVRLKTCSPECQHELRSQKGRENPGLGTFRSKDEIKLFELCKEKFQDSEPNVKLVDNWDADISIPSLKIAIFWNGPWHYKDMKMKSHSLEQVQNRDRIKTKLFQEHGWKVIVFEDRYYTPETAFEELCETILKNSN